MPNQKKIKLIVEGGGTKINALPGVLRAIEEANLTITSIDGTSAGAIMAVLVAAGYTAEELELVALETDKRNNPVSKAFLEIPQLALADYRESLIYKVVQRFRIPLGLDFAFIWALSQFKTYRAMFSLVHFGGLFSGNEFRKWMFTKLYQKDTRLPACTLRDFYHYTGMEVLLCAVDTTSGELLTLRWDTAPNLPVIEAVRMSMSIPGIWQECTWEAEFGKYKGKVDVVGHSIVDGGVLCNFPIQFTGPYRHAVGVLFAENLKVPGIEDYKTSFLDLLLNSRIVSRFSNLVRIMMLSQDKQNIERFKSKICFVPCGGFGTLEMDMPEKRRKALISSGYNAMSKYLYNRFKSG